MAQAVSFRPVTAQAWIRFQASPYEVCGRRSGTPTCFCPSTSFSPVRISPAMSCVCLHTPCQKDKRTKPGKLHKAVFFLEIGKQWFTFLFFILNLFFTFLWNLLILWSMNFIVYRFLRVLTRRKLIFIVKTKRLTPCREAVAFYCENYTKHGNIRCGKA